ncbi:hypothetical protein OHA25_51670 [Nonomuraea sp. NBC_00507]|uniref:hypothetical protein n=1 Tax=Nonomuraea sp. NBC_00507 TaxID=2976002 RepID=UPI002E19DFA9
MLTGDRRQRVIFRELPHTRLPIKTSVGSNTKPKSTRLAPRVRTGDEVMRRLVAETIDRPPNVTFHYIVVAPET